MTEQYSRTVFVFQSLRKWYDNIMNTPFVNV